MLIMKKTRQQLILTYTPAFSCCFMKFHPSKRCVAVKPIASASILIHAVHKNKQNVESMLRLLFFEPESFKFATLYCCLAVFPPNAKHDKHQGFIIFVY